MANKRFIDFPIATTVGDNDIILIWQGGANKQTTKATILSGVPDSLNDLTDVTISGLTNGQILRYDSVTGQWENTDQGNLDLNDLNDVTIVSPTNGQVLVYNSSTSKWENSSGGYVPYVGAVTTVDLGLQGLEAGYVRFDTSIVSVPDEQGLMYWDASRSTVALIMNGTLQHIGQDTFFYVKNSSGSSIPKGTCVRFAGTDGASGHLLITPFLANGSVPSTYFLGVTAEEITNGSFGQVMHFGELEGINTSSYTAGDLLYASTTVAGAFQTTAPVAPNNIVLVAAAVNSKNNGAIVVRPTYGSNINNDEGVKITSPTTGDLLQLQAGGLWENKTIDAAGIVTKATNQTITGVKTFSQDIIVNGVNVGMGGGNVPGNVILGATLANNTTGIYNSAINSGALANNTTGRDNVSIGFVSLYSNTTGQRNTSIGNESMYDNLTGSENTAIGLQALSNITSGNWNVSIGNRSATLAGAGGGGLFTSNNSIYIGYDSRAGADSQTNQIVIGHQAIGNGSNTVTIGNSSILSNRFFGTMRIGTINNGVGDFITTDANGVLTKRTGAEVRTDIGAGTVTSVAALTLGTSGTDLSSTVANGTTTPVITLNVPTASATNRGALSAADWTTFNNKQNALTNPVTGTGTTNYLPKFTGSTTIGNSALYDGGSFGGFNTTGLAARTFVINAASGRPLALELIENANVHAIYFRPNNSGYNLISSNYISGGVYLPLSVSARENNADLVLATNGNLLVGTTSDNGARLNLNGSQYIRGGNELRFYRIDNAIYTQLYDAGSTFALDNRNGNGFSFQSAGTNQFVISPSGAATFSSSVTTGGNVLIPAGSGLAWSGDASRIMTPEDNVSGALIQTPGIIRLNAGGAERVRITSTGNVLIGTTTDNGAKLQVSGNVRISNGGQTDGALVVGRNGNNNSILAVSDANNTSEAYIRGFSTSSSSSTLIIYSNGNIVNTNGSYGTISDIKYKENISDANFKLDDILNLKVRNFNLIGDTKKQIGFIAQEFEEIFPSLVETDGLNGFKMIKTSVLIPILVKAIQELNQKIK